MFNVPLEDDRCVYFLCTLDCSCNNGLCKFVANEIIYSLAMPDDGLLLNGKSNSRVYRDERRK